MKKVFSIAVCLLASTLIANAESSIKCLLQHQGKVSSFDAEKIANAITAAVDGDTIFLTAGEFPGFTISKKITVRGAGQATKITGDVYINIAGTPTLTQTVLEGVDLESNSKSVRLSSAMKGVKIKQCSMYRLLNTSAINYNITIDRCYISTEMYSQDEYTKSMTVINSDLTIGRDYTNSLNTISYVNCNVYLYRPSQVAGTFINCTVKNNYSYSIQNSTFVNCLFRWNATFSSSTTAQQCYYDTNCTWDAATFEALGYLGNDGRVVGYMGGTTPYTLELAVPKVTDSRISLDPESRVLNINIKVAAK